MVLARGDMFPDALAGVPLAAKVKGPLLLTDPKSLTPETGDEIRRVLGAGSGKAVYILGGTGAVSAGVQDALSRAGYAVTRFSGADRYATALDVARRGLGDPAHVVVATGGGYADALAAGPFAAGPDAVNGSPAAVVLSAGNVLDGNTAAYVRMKFGAVGGDCAAVTAVGGQADAAVRAIAPAGTCSESDKGADRYATARAVADKFAAPKAVGIATGSGFADALTGGAAMATLGQPLLLTDPKTLSDEPHSWVKSAHSAGLSAVVVFGGTGAVSDGVYGQLGGILGGSTPPPPPPAGDLCGAPQNPYGLNYCGTGATIVKAQVPADICDIFTCIGTAPSHDSFWAGQGYLELCNDGDISLSGGRSGACSSHGGESHPVWKR